MFTESLKSFHCPTCGIQNPQLEDGYTTCCNKAICHGDDQKWTDGRDTTILGCCAYAVADRFAGGFYLDF